MRVNVCDEMVLIMMFFRSHERGLPAHLTAPNGHEGVIKLLHKVVSDTHLQVHSSKLLSIGGLCKMTVAIRARCGARVSPFHQLCDKVLKVKVWVETTRHMTLTGGDFFWMSWGNDFQVPITPRMAEFHSTSTQDD